MKLYQSDYQSQKMMLKDKLHGTRMFKGDSMTSYLSKLTQVKNELVVVGEMIVEEELVHIALNGFSKHQMVFVKCVMGQDHLPDWARLWDDFV